MGMSASQARLIALTARMSDTEYEAQQINQQRLTLSNKMNAVYEAMCNMEVPTPPSKSDPQYSKTIYRGSGADKDLVIRPNDDGTFTANRTVKNGEIVVSSGAKEVGNVIDPKKYLESTPIKSEEAKSYKIADFYQQIGDGYSPKQTNEGEFAQENKKVYVSGTISINSLEKVVTQEAQEEKSHYDAEKGETVIDQEAKEEIFHYEVKAEEKEITENTLRADFENTYQNQNVALSATNSDGSVVQIDKYTGLDTVKIDHITGFKNVSGEFQSEATYVAKEPSERSGTLSGSAAIAQNNKAKEMESKNYVIDNGNNNYEIVTGKELAELSGVIVHEIKKENLESFKKAVTDIKSGDGGTTVGGNPTMSMDNAVSRYGEGGTETDTAFVNALNGLKHSFPDSYNTDFTVIVATDKSGTRSFSFCKTEDLNADATGHGDGMTNVYEYGHGEYEEPIEKLSADAMEFDENGDVVAATVNGNKVKLVSEKEFDEDLYDTDVEKYKNAKEEYDQEQNRLNHQTSIYQRQDKQLEMKLTRLDTERNALNTELEAVKKVIQDSIDKSFKTFSG